MLSGLIESEQLDEEQFLQKDLSELSKSKRLDLIDSAIKHHCSLEVIQFLLSLKDFSSKEERFGLMMFAIMFGDNNLDINLNILQAL